MLLISYNAQEKPPTTEDYPVENVSNATVDKLCLTWNSQSTCPPTQAVSNSLPTLLRMSRKPKDDQTYKKTSDKEDRDLDR